MSIVGLTLEHAGEQWDVATVRREGPEWRIAVTSTQDPRRRLIAYTEGPSAPQSGDVRHALAESRFRTFPDNEGRVWRAEISPRYEYGSVHGSWLVFSAEDGPDRAKFAFEGSGGLGLLPEIKLLEFLLRARKGH